MRFSRLTPAMAGLALLAFTSHHAGAQANVAACAGIQDAQERLACYDRVAENTRELPVVRVPRASQPQAEPPAQSPEPANPPVVRQEAPAPEAQQRQQDAEPDRQTYTVAAARHNDFTGWTIEFDGGGTWKQVGTDDYRIRVGEQYTIERAAFNSYFLLNSRNNRKIRIRRVE